MDDDLCAEPLYVLEGGKPVPSIQERKVQALQAAYIVCLYQNWEGGDAGKRRIRRFRFGTMVAVSGQYAVFNLSLRGTSN